MPEEAAPTPSVPCKHCRQLIPTGARICSKCNHYQDWRGHLSISSTILALLIALLSVATTATPVIVDALTPSGSSVRISEPTLDGLTLRFVISNRGKEAASIYQANLRPGIAGAPIELRLREEEDAFVPPGSKLVVYDVVPFVTEQRAQEIYVQSLSRSYPSRDDSDLGIVVQDSGGSVIPYEFKIGAAYIAVMLREHATRCSSLRPLTLASGCLGHNEPPPDPTGRVGV